MNIALIGYGAMGREIESVAAEREHAISCRFSSKNPFFEASLPATDCCIDFSSSGCVERNIEHALELRIPIVVGTTGWSSLLPRIQRRVEEAGGAVVHSPNFSIGANIFFRIVNTAALLMDRYEQYDVSIHETHHTRKKDAPSGTAVTLARSVIEHIGRKQRITQQPEPDGLVVTSSRIGSVVGDHSVRFNSTFDDIILTHQAHNRRGFALGAILAAEWVVGKKGFFTFDDVLRNEGPAASFEGLYQRSTEGTHV